jgi:hypothetical protein
MFKVSFPDPGESHVFVWSENAEDQLSALLGETPGRLQALEGLDDFMTKLAVCGGNIVSSERCSLQEIADAQVDKRFIMRADGLGFVLRLPESQEPHP